jgi:hypothetical protein
MRAFAPAPAVTVLLALSMASQATAQEEVPTYDLTLEVTFDPDHERLSVELEVRQSARELRQLTLRPGRDWASHYSGWATEDGELTRDGDHQVWEVPQGGGKLSYQIALQHRRHGDADAGFDACITDDWAVLQSEILLPRPSWRRQTGAEARTTLQLRAPSGWQYNTPFTVTGSGRFAIEDPTTSLARPRGWIIAGRRLARRHTSIAGCQLLVAAPPDLAPDGAAIYDFLEVNLPPLLEVFERLPERILVVSAGDPMWRGGVSGTKSVFLNSDLTLIQRDGTCTVLHELVHVLTQPPGQDADGDWFVEGIAEYYCLEAQIRAGSIDRARLDECLDLMRERSGEVETIRVGRSSGRVTQRAVLALYAIDAAIREGTGGAKSLDDVARVMDSQLEDRTTASFLALCEQVSGLSLEQTFRDEVP